MTEAIIMDEPPEEIEEHGVLCYCAECLPYPKPPEDENGNIPHWYWMGQFVTPPPGWKEVSRIHDSVIYEKEQTGATTPKTEPCTTADYNPDQDR